MPLDAASCSSTTTGAPSPKQALHTIRSRWRLRKPCSGYVQSALQPLDMRRKALSLNGYGLKACCLLLVLIYLHTRNKKADIPSYTEFPGSLILEEEPLLRFNTPDNLKYGAIAVGLSSLVLALLVAV